MTNNDERRALDLPQDTSLPFFAYGIFKPGQLAYSKIKDHVKDYNKIESDYEMLMRDGVPLIRTPINKGHHKTLGYLIRFRQKQSQDAYDIISKTAAKKFYRWEEIEVDQKRANVLMGVKPNKGTSHIEGTTGDYDGKKDPYFKEALAVVENELNDDSKHWSNINDFFRLQMSYLLLWTAIERYASLKYNCPKIWQKWKILSKEEAFKKSLKRHVEINREVFSAEDLRKYVLNPNKPYDSVKYYYTIRCNAAHRGKELHNDDLIIRQSLRELLEIFRDVLEDAFESHDPENH